MHGLTPKEIDGISINDLELTLDAIVNNQTLFSKSSNIKQFISNIIYYY